MGRFSTEIDIMLHQTVKDCFRSTKLIGQEDDAKSLERYSNELLKQYIEKQVIYFPNSMNTIDSYIVKAGIIFDNAIIKGEIAINDMPAV